MELLLLILALLVGGAWLFYIAINLGEHVGRKLNASDHQQPASPAHATKTS